MMPRRVDSKRKIQQNEGGADPRCHLFTVAREILIAKIELDGKKELWDTERNRAK